MQSLKLRYKKHEPQASIFYISRVFSNARLRLLHLLYDIDFVLSDKTWVFDRSECAQGPIYIINSDKSKHGFSTNQSAHIVLAVL